MKEYLGSKFDVMRCKDELQRTWRSVYGPLSPLLIIMTYATAPLPHDFLLGLSAAYHNVPIVVAGQGQRGWGKWDSWRPKVEGPRNALRLIRELAPGEFDWSCLVLMRTAHSVL